MCSPGSVAAPDKAAQEDLRFAQSEIPRFARKDGRCRDQLGGNAKIAT
jgi:hypothetical protein